MERIGQDEYGDLVTGLRESLGDRGYTEYQEATIPRVGHARLVMTPRRWTSRHVCAVVATPDGVATLAQCKELLVGLRGYLARTYGGFPGWKEVGTYLVLLCPSGLCDAIADRTAELRDRTGLYTNVILGTIVVDRDRYETTASSTWGLFNSGDHFVDIQRVVRAWCKERQPVH